MTNKHTMNLCIDRELNDRLTACSKLQNCSKAQIIEKALRLYFESIDLKPQMMNQLAELQNLLADWDKINKK